MRTVSEYAEKIGKLRYLANMLRQIDVHPSNKPFAESSAIELDLIADWLGQTKVDHD